MNRSVKKLTGLKGHFPFRLGTTSYIIPDDIIPNVTYLADKVDDIELVLFESDLISNIPDKSTVSDLRTLAVDNALTYNVHLPLDAFLGSSDEHKRRESVGKCLRIIDRMSAAEPAAYVLHFHGDRRGAHPSDDTAGWLAAHRKSVTELFEHIDPRMLAVETLDYPYELIWPVVKELNLATCLDIGHIILCGFPLDAYFDTYLSNTRIVHLHGVRGKNDHVDLSYLDPKILGSIIKRLSGFDGELIVSLEIFSEKDLFRSFDAIRSLKI